MTRPKKAPNSNAVTQGAGLKAGDDGEDEQARNEEQVEDDGCPPVGLVAEREAQLALVETAGDDGQPDHVDRQESDECGCVQLT